MDGNDPGPAARRTVGAKTSRILGSFQRIIYAHRRIKNAADGPIPKSTAANLGSSTAKAKATETIGIYGWRSVNIFFVQFFLICCVFKKISNFSG